MTSINSLNTFAPIFYPAILIVWLFEAIRKAVVAWCVLILFQRLLDVVSGINLLKLSLWKLKHTVMRVTRLGPAKYVGFFGLHKAYNDNTRFLRLSLVIIIRLKMHSFWDGDSIRPRGWLDQFVMRLVSGRPSFSGYSVSNVTFFTPQPAVGSWTILISWEKTYGLIQFGGTSA